MLSVVSSIYDPLGFLAPLTLPAKCLLQELCKQNHGWDQLIPKATSEKWLKWTSDLVKLAVFKVERCIKQYTLGNQFMPNYIIFQMQVTMAMVQLATFG
jgi:hypothetical protein